MCRPAFHETVRQNIINSLLDNKEPLKFDTWAQKPSKEELKKLNGIELYNENKGASIEWLVFAVRSCFAGFGDIVLSGEDLELNRNQVYVQLRNLIKEGVIVGEACKGNRRLYYRLQASWVAGYNYAKVA